VPARRVANATPLVNVGRAWFAVLWPRPLGHGRAAGDGLASEAVAAGENSWFESRYLTKTEEPRVRISQCETVPCSDFEAGARVRIKG
jgi:hypothetical protein